MFTRIVLASLGLLFAFAVNGATAPVVIMSPQGGEIFLIGQTQYVRLATTTKFKSVRIELSRDGGATFAVLGVIDNTVPKANRNVLQFSVTGPVANNCVIRATGISPTAPGTGLTGSFAITDTIGPAAGETAGGDLTGTYPNPAIALNTVTTAKVADLAITASKINSEASSTNFLLAANGSGGASWISPAGLGGASSTSYIQNQNASPQAADFNISGSGTIGGNLTVNGTTTIPTTTRYTSIHWSAFMNTFGTSSVAAGVFAYFPSSPTNSCYAPVYLPHGATITQFQAQIVGSNGTQNAVSLQHGTDGQILSTVSYNGSPNTSSLVSNTLVHVVDNQNSVYFITGSGGGGILFARVIYTVNQPLP